MKRWQLWLGNRIAELKSPNSNTPYERIGQQIRAELRDQQHLDPTQRMVLNHLENKIPGKLGILIGKVYRAYMKSEEGKGVALSSKQRDTQ